MRSGKHSYSGKWDADTMIGPEQTVLDNKGDVIRPGDSLIVEFKDTSEQPCNPSASAWKRIVGIDGGHDLEFQNLWIKISPFSATYRLTDGEPITIPLDSNYFGGNFRFRVRLKAKNDAKISPPQDDDDQWYLDNFSLEVPRLPEIEMRWVRIVTPFTKIPYSAAAALPVFVRIKNNFSGFISPALHIVVKITDTTGYVYYTRYDTIISFSGGADTIIRMPDWNAQSAINNSSKFIVDASIVGYFDNYTQDNETQSTFYLNVEKGANAIQEFAYDDAGITPGVGDGNDIPFIAKVTGGGIGFQKTGGGSYAVKFILPRVDTIYGARIYFASGNPSPDPIRIWLLQGNSNSCVPGELLQQAAGGTTFLAERGSGSFDQFTPYYFPKPVEVPAGVYWLSVSQISRNSFMIGGDLSRGGGEILVADSLIPNISPVYKSPYGTQWSPTQNSGDVSCAFAVEVPAGSGNWAQWMPGSGFWPTNVSGSGHQAFSWNPTLTSPYVRGGSFMPMIRVMVGSYGSIHSQAAVEHSLDFGFETIYPNPFTPGANSVELNFTLSEEGAVSLIIYDEVGREIRTLINSKLDMGSHKIFWDGRDVIGGFVAQGMYFCRLKCGERTATVKVSVIE